MQHAINRKAAFNGWLAFAASLIAPLLVVALVLHRSGLVASILGASGTVPAELVAAFGDTCDALVAPASGEVDQQAQQQQQLPAPTVVGLLNMPQFLGGSFVWFVALQGLSKALRRYVPYLSKREVANLMGTQKYVTVDLLELKKSLYKEYLNECSYDPSGML